MKRAMVVLSGGQDSTACLFWAKQSFDEVHAVTFDYGQRHDREIQAARKVAEMADVASHEVVAVGPILLGASPLTDRSQKLETYSDYASMDRIIGDRVELTFVPMRNLLFLTLAANRAVVRGCAAVVTGICQADNANYPDCRASFAKLAERTINEALGQVALAIVTPLMDLSKAETVRLSATLPGCMEALAYSHTCYAGEWPPCGRCHACVLRAHGFAEAGVQDPLIPRQAPDLSNVMLAAR